MDPEVIEEAPSLRETLEEAIEEHDPQHELIPQAESTDAGTVEESIVPAEGAATPGETPKPADPAAPQPVAEPPAQPPQAAAPTELKAPAQWKREVAEHWNKLPRAVQEEIHRRESDTMRLIGTVGPKIRMADEVAQHLSPFAERLSQNGIGPSAFIGDVFGSIKTLASGNAQARAEVVANIVQSYGVDVRMLDQILTYRLNMPPEVHHARELAARAQAVIQQNNAGVEQQSAAKAEAALEAFAADPKHEFFGNVRVLMADLIDSGRAQNLEEAYSAAIWADEPTRKILLQREAQTRASSKTRRASTARVASSSIHGTPSLPAPATNQGNGSMSLRESLEAAFDEHSPL